jgi:hypothetical protein
MSPTQRPEGPCLEWDGIPFGVRKGIGAGYKGEGYLRFQSHKGDAVESATLSADEGKNLITGHQISMNSKLTYSSQLNLFIVTCVLCTRLDLDAVADVPIVVTSPS